MQDPFEVARQWAGRLRPIQLFTPKPLLPAPTIPFLHHAGLPTRFQVSTYQRIRFTFSTTAKNLALVWERQMPDWSFPQKWNRLWRIGNITTTQAKAWLCVEELTGRVVAVDVDLDDPLYVVNGSVERLVRCMRVLDDWSRSGDATIARVSTLTSALSNDPELPVGEAGHFWLPRIEEAAQSGCGRFEVSWE